MKEIVVQNGTMDIVTSDPLLEFPPNVVVNIRSKYNLDNGRMTQSVDLLEDWVKKQKHFTNKNFNRRYLEASIILCKGSVEKAKKQIDKLCTLRTILPNFFIDRDLKSKFELINQYAKLLVLPKLTKEYQRVFILKVNEKEFTSAHYLEYYRLCLVLAEYLKAHDYSDGYVLIEDFRDVNMFDIVTKINLIELQHLITILIEGFGARLQGIHIISQSKMAEMLVNGLKPVIPEKIAKRIHIKSEIEELYDVIEKDILPVDFGGKEKSLGALQAHWTEILCSEDHQKYLKVMKASCTDESKRETDKFNEQYMGMPGTFRTLTVD